MSLTLIAASLLLVAIDDLAAPTAKHVPGSCPVCTWASGLAVGQMPVPAAWIEHGILHWAPRDVGSVFCAQFFCRSFSARSPPAPAPA